MTPTINNGYAKRLHLYVTALGAAVAIALSVLGYVKEVRDDKARTQAGEGLNQQQETIAALRESVQFNRQLLLQLYQSTTTRARTKRTSPDRSRGSNAERPRPTPSADRDAYVPTVPRLIPPDELFKKAPPIPRQEKRDWKNYEQRAQ